MHSNANCSRDFIGVSREGRGIVIGSGWRVCTFPGVHAMPAGNLSQLLAWAAFEQYGLDTGDKRMDGSWRIAYIGWILPDDSKNE